MQRGKNVNNEQFDENAVYVHMKYRNSASWSHALSVLFEIKIRSVLFRPVVEQFLAYTNS